MFSETKKNVKPEVTGLTNRIIAKTSIKGDITAESDIRFDGELEGSVKTSGKVVIGKTGYVNGIVNCENADIEGKFHGELHVNGILTLKATAIIEGNVVAGKLAIEPGAHFNATCTMKGNASSIKAIKEHAEISA
ncbi:polymer-forming cytoskeletal protein [Zhouia sp. PK063]|uniref:polymer-forming cytoskeletal protein n=1 Tax=Zhouia sp. PK063 TaxID=3373602 RepID=UPI003799EF51